MQRKHLSVALAAVLALMSGALLAGHVDAREAFTTQPVLELAQIAQDEVALASREMARIESPLF